MHRSCTTVSVLNDIASQQEVRPKGPSAMLPLSPQLKMLLINLNRTFRLLPYLKIYIKKWSSQYTLFTGTGWVVVSMGGYPGTWVFTNLKLTQILGSNHLLYSLLATIFAFKTAGHRRNVK